ncbi:hypothetical protein HBB16_15260 [Pseudonocardia sp. MCCB 268]|nr:hypothetical protein [Pseudonocardia cytotoxica]
MRVERVALRDRPGCGRRARPRRHVDVNAAAMMRPTSRKSSTWSPGWRAPGADPQAGRDGGRPPDRTGPRCGSP